MSIFPRNILGLSLCNFLCFFFFYICLCLLFVPVRPFDILVLVKKGVSTQMAVWPFQPSLQPTVNQSNNKNYYNSSASYCALQDLMSCFSCVCWCTLYISLYYDFKFVCLFVCLVGWLLGWMVGVLLCGPRVPWGRICISLYSSQG